MNNIERLQQRLLPEEAYVIEDDFNRLFYTGFEASNGVIAVTKTDAVFFTDFRYIEAATKNITGCRVAIIKGSHYDCVKSVFAGKGLKKVYFEADSCSYNYGAGLKASLSEYECVAGDKVLAEIRAEKTEAEIENIKQSQAITDKGFEYILGYVKENYKNGLSEKQIALELEFYLRRNGSGKMPFDIICASGENTSRPHAEPSDKLVEEGDFITVDFGSSYNCYASDMTRTFAVGSVTDKMRNIYDLVLTAQLESMKHIKAGVIGFDVDAVARNIFKEKGLAEYFGHGLGHSLGLYIHEDPNFNMRWKEPIPANAVLSVEPGLYFEGEFGVRIEDIVRITPTGCEVITKSPKELIIL